MGFFKVLRRANRGRKWSKQYQAKQRKPYKPRKRKAYQPKKYKSNQPIEETTPQA